MSLNRFAKRRDKGEDEIVAALKARGAFVWKLDRPLDLLVGYRGVWLLIEAKSKRGRLTEGQSEFMSDCRARNLCVYQVRTVTEALAALDDAAERKIAP